MAPATTPFPQAASSRDSTVGRPVKGRPRLKLWVVFGESVKFGEGRAELLEAVERLGSFKKAVEQMGMSYRAAWGYFRELERAAGVKFLESHPGRGPDAGTRLTPEGRRFLKRYRRFRQSLDGLVTRHFEQSFRD
jgi:molybdate transport system regulatory protein